MLDVAAARPGGPRRGAARARRRGRRGRHPRPGDARAQALDGADAVVHLAAIVGDPACARDPSCRARGQRRGVAVRSSPTPRGRRGALRVRLDVLELRADGRPDRADRRGRASSPRSRSTPSRRSAIEQHAARRRHAPSPPTCLRFATVYGVAPRMRFDLTVNEFTRDLWADRELEVFGEQFWRPYVHVRDAGARRSARCSRRRSRRSPARSSTSATRGENYRKLDLVEEIRKQTDRGDGRPTSSATRTRATTRSASTRSAAELGFETR